MKLLKRILLTLFVCVVLVYVGFQWIIPAALSLYAAHKAPAVARVVPTELKDHTVADAPGSKLTYFGYEFEVPWNDLDDTQTKLYPTGNQKKNRVDLHFRSGLRLIVTAIPPNEWIHDLPAEFKVSPQMAEAAFGADAMKSDYSFLKTVYEFTPDKMNHLMPFHGTHRRDQFLLIIKSLAPLKAAESGIFYIQNQNFRGFQQGDPLVSTDGIAVNLYADDGSVEMLFRPKDYHKPSGITQAELNRVIGSLRRAQQNISVAARNVTSNGVTQATLSPKNQ